MPYLFHLLLPCWKQSSLLFAAAVAPGMFKLLAANRGQSLQRSLLFSSTTLLSISLLCFLFLSSTLLCDLFYPIDIFYKRRYVALRPSPSALMLPRLSRASGCDKRRPSLCQTAKPGHILNTVSLNLAAAAHQRANNVCSLLDTSYNQTLLAMPHNPTHATSYLPSKARLQICSESVSIVTYSASYHL